MAAVARQKGRPGNLASMLEADRATAALSTPAEGQIAAWHAAQLANLEERAAKQRAVADRNLAALATPDDERWPAYWLIEAKARYLEASLKRVRDHMVPQVCPNHGIDGVDPAEVIAAYQGEDKALEAAATALSLRGLLGTESAGPHFYWRWYCLKCSAPQLEAEAKSLQAAHEAANAPKRGKR